MSAATTETLKTFFDKNNFKDKGLPEIRIQIQTNDSDNTTVEEEGWIRRPLGLGGPMGVALYAKNYLFRDGSSAAKKVLLREAITEAQDQAPSQLKGRKWPARRVAEALSNCLLSADKWNDNELCFSAVCALFQLQMLIIDTEKKSLAFSPADPRVWKQELPVYMLSKDGRWLFLHPTDECWKVSGIVDWIANREAAGWKVEWPLADGTMETLRDIVEDAGFAVEGRIKKEELAKRAGKIQALKYLGLAYEGLDDDL